MVNTPPDAYASGRFGHPTNICCVIRGLAPLIFAQLRLFWIMR